MAKSNSWQKALLSRHEGTVLFGLYWILSSGWQCDRVNSVGITAQRMPGSPCYDALQQHAAMGLCSMKQTGYSGISIQPRKSAAAESPRSHRVGLLLAGVSNICREDEESSIRVPHLAKAKPKPGFERFCSSFPERSSTVLSPLDFPVRLAILRHG